MLGGSAVRENLGLATLVPGSYNAIHIQHITHTHTLIYPSQAATKMSTRRKSALDSSSEPPSIQTLSQEIKSSRLSLQQALTTEEGENHC